MNVYLKVRLTNLKIGYERPNHNISHYRMSKHSKRIKNPKRSQLLKKATKRLGKDGLNNVKYKLVDVVKYRMFTHFLIDVGNPPKDLLDAIEKETNKIRDKAIAKIVAKSKGKIKIYLKKKTKSVNDLEGNND